MLSSFFQKKSHFLVYIIVYTSINSIIQCIGSIIDSSFFTSNEFALRSIDSKVDCP